MRFLRKQAKSYDRAMGWFKANMVSDKGIIVHTRQPVPYPEVTGYFVPTLYQWGEAELARTCTTWLLSVQLPDGAFPAPDGVPYTFDTAQVIRGLCAALEPLVAKPSPEIRLTFDPARIMFLQEDQQDAARYPGAPRFRKEALPHPCSPRAMPFWFARWPPAAPAHSAFQE